MSEDAYPLSHWDSYARSLSAGLRTAVAQALRLEPGAPSQELPGGAHLLSHEGGNHAIMEIRLDGRSYCLKRPRPTHRNESEPDRVIRREVGGLCVAQEFAGGRAPAPLAWNAAPAWVLMEWIPGTPLGNGSLLPEQLHELACATRDLAAVRPATSEEPLWNIDWPIEWLLHWQQERLADLQARTDDASRAAAQLVSDWLHSPDPARFLEESDFLVFTRGDQNLANVIWDGATARFVDFEYCGWNDLPRDLSLLTEHIQSYQTTIEAWDAYIDHFGLSIAQRRRCMAGRRRGALAWLTKECLKPGSLHSCPEEGRLEALLQRAMDLCRGR